MSWKEVRPLKWPIAKTQAQADTVDRERAFEDLFQARWPKVHAVLARLLGDPDEAEDLALETFSRLYDRFDRLENQERLGGWLYRTAVNLGLNALRDTSRRQRYEQQAVREAPGTGLPDPAHAAEGAESRRQVRAVLAQMKDRPAALLLLRSSGLSYTELSQAVGIPLSSIGTQLSRAEQEFARRYRAEYGEPR